MKRASITKRDREIQTCSHGDCEAHRIWDFPTCWAHLTNTERDQLKARLAEELRRTPRLPCIVLTGANLAGFDFTKTDLRGAFLDQCDLTGAKFVDANLTGAYLGWANLKGANLVRANLHGTVFTNANLSNVLLAAYSLSNGMRPVNLRARLFGEWGLFSRPALDESNLAGTEATYLALKRLFMEEGRHDDASWAAYCERVMQRKGLWRDNHWLDWVNSLLFGAMSGYGERPLRVVITLVVGIAAYAVHYRLPGTLTGAGKTSADWADAFYFSATTLCTMSVPGYAAGDGVWTHAAVASEAIFGLFLFGLFVFALTRRFSAR
jgi:uncharacterized protein YjbI with pentapeptide repeats